MQAFATKRSTRSRAHGGVDADTHSFQAPLSSVSDALVQRQAACSCGGGCPRCAPAAGIAGLPVSRPGDRLEREADRIADSVMGASRGGDAALPQGADGGTDRGLGGTLGAGQPLDAATRDFFELRFGRDLSGVRVHAGETAAESAHAMRASAYTVGQDVVFGGGRYSPGTDAGRRLIAHELAHTVQQADGATAVQRQPEEGAEEAPQEIQSFVFAGDKKLKTDKAFAQRSGVEIAARVLSAQVLTRDLRMELNGMLAFFEGEAKDVYIEQIKPALVTATSAGEVEQGIKDPNAFLKSMLGHDRYIDNRIRLVEFFYAEQARIHYYNDGPPLLIGLVPRWIEPPIKEVDYRTPPDQVRFFHDPKTKQTRVLYDADMARASRTTPFSELQERYARPVDFHVVDGRIIPSIINMQTAPNLCWALIDAERRWGVEVEFAISWGTQVAHVVGSMGGGGLGQQTMVRKTAAEARREAAEASARMAAQRAASPAVKQLTGHLDDLLLKGGTRDITVEGILFEGVRAARRGSTLSVNRFMIRRVNAPPGHGAVVSEAFEDAAKAVARRQGMKTVTINVGVITNPGWREWLESIGYVFVQKQGAWIKTIKL